jgi:hypothetical protein
MFCASRSVAEPPCFTAKSPTLTTFAEASEALRNSVLCRIVAIDGISHPGIIDGVLNARNS